jgi:hypothetical protein
MSILLNRMYLIWAEDETMPQVLDHIPCEKGGMKPYVVIVLLDSQDARQTLNVRNFTYHYGENASVTWWDYQILVAKPPRHAL